MASHQSTRFISSRKRNASNSSTEQRKLQNQISSYALQYRADTNSKALEARAVSLSSPINIDVRGMDVFIEKCFGFVDKLLGIPTPSELELTRPIDPFQNALPCWLRPAIADGLCRRSALRASWKTPFTNPIALSW